METEGLRFQTVAQEVLGYMHVLVTPEPRVVLQCVQQLLAALFGNTKVATSKPPRPSVPVSMMDATGTESAEDSAPLYDYASSATDWTPVGAGVGCVTGFFERCTVVAPTQQTVEGRTIMAQPRSSPTEELPRSQGGGALSGMGGGSSASTTNGAGKGSADGVKESALNKSMTAGLIRLFEPLVIRAMNMYTSTSSVPLQIQILDLLNILLALRVNYTLLDSDMLFVKSILKQLDLIEHGHVRDVQDLLSHLFLFLSHLAHDHNKLGDNLNMPRLLQLGDQLLASVHLAPRHALPALEPIVQELFFTSARRQRRGVDREAELLTLREVVTNTLIKQIRHPAVWEMLGMLLGLYVALCCGIVCGCVR